jgi:hypothetical protein
MLERARGYRHCAERGHREAKASRVFCFLRQLALANLVTYPRTRESKQLIA